MTDRSFLRARNGSSIPFTVVFAVLIKKQTSILLLQRLSSKSSTACPAAEQGSSPKLIASESTEKPHPYPAAWRRPVWAPATRVQRESSETARCVSKETAQVASPPQWFLKGVARPSFTARIGRAQFYRARSASKKEGLAAPDSSFLRGYPRTPADPRMNRRFLASLHSS